MRHRDGFTLIELMIVVVIIGVLAAIAIPKFSSTAQSAKQAEAAPILKQIFTLEERYRAKNDAYTFTVDDLEGGPSLTADLKYFTITLSAHPSGFCAAAVPSAAGVAAGVTAQSVDANRTFHESANCS